MKVTIIPVKVDRILTGIIRTYINIFLPGDITKKQGLVKINKNLESADFQYTFFLVRMSEKPCSEIMGDKQ